MAPFKSSLARTASKLLSVYNQKDLTLRGQKQSGRNIKFTSSGGTIINVGSDVIHVFTSPGTLTFSGIYDDAKVLLIGGGGAGGTNEGSGHYAMGGGGAGGMVSLTGQTFSAGSYSITIGDGGTPDSPGHGDARRGGNGDPSTAFGLTAYGGGGGGGGPNQSGLNGGSGGGGGSIGSGGSGGTGDRQTGTGTPASPSPQGNPGGDGSPGPAPAPNRYGAGGGGAGGMVSLTGQTFSAGSYSITIGDVGTPD